MMSFLALHSIAAQRGDGLRPELLALLERQKEIAAELKNDGHTLESRAQQLAAELTASRWTAPNLREQNTHKEISDARVVLR